MTSRSKAFGRCAVRLFAGLCALVLSAHAASPPAKPTHHASITAATEAASADQSLVLVIFGAEWCGPCKLLHKNTLASEDFLAGAGALRMVEIDIDADEKTATSYDVSAVPTLVLMTAEGKIAARQSGFMDVTQLLKWLDDGRQRVKQGQWEGTAQGTKLNEFVAKAAAERLEEGDLKKLVALLGEPDPAERVSAAKILLAQREQAMPPLIDALGDSYLGIRIGAAELLQKLTPEASRLDPWQSPKDMSDAIAQFKKWWAENGKLPAATETRKVDPSLLGSIRAAVESLRGNDGAKQTEAMSTLVAHGDASLPEIRDGIRRSDKAGDQRAVSLLEDVRWAILVPDSVEQRANARIALARGTSQERQAAATRLGRGGREAIAALAELASDPDSLVIENAVRALSNIGGKDTIPAMAALLKAGDPNLRMTAAQALGHTKDSEATQPLLKAVADSNEVVACTALAALEEIHGGEGSGFSGFTSYSPGKRNYPNEIVSVLKTALSDGRWRVRAAAAEVIGKLQITELKNDLKILLNDSDGFVVKNALTSLAAMTALPEPEQLAALAKRLPSMRGEALRLMAKSSGAQAAPIATGLYTNSDTAGRLAMLTALAQRDRFDTTTLEDDWQPFVAAALREPDAALRQAAAQLLSRLPQKTAAQLIDGPLADEDREVRSTAAEAVLWIVSGREAQGSFGGMAIDEDDLPVPGLTGRNSGGKTNEPIATPARQAAWRETMLKQAGQNADATLATAIYALGDGKTDLPLLAKSLSNLDSSSAQKLAVSPAMMMLLPKLPWPESEPLLIAFSNSPALFAVAASKSFTAAPPVRAWFTNAARFAAVLERASSEELAIGLPSVLRTGGGVALLAPSTVNRDIALALARSTNAGCRAAGVYALGYQGNAGALAVLTNAARDEHPGVRAAAAQSLARFSPERKDLEERLGPMLADADLRVAQVAALALLEPEIRTASGLEWSLQYFVFEDIHAGGGNSMSSENSERPLAPLETKPAYLEHARTQLKKAGNDDMVPFALLLAQHGEFDAISLLTARARAREARGDGSAQAVLTAIALSRDAKHIPALRAMLDGSKDEWELRGMLRALRGMSGPEVRQLRLEINKQIRKTTE